MRFFFAHSHAEHEFVRAVADHVGRPFVVFDEYVFESGKTFKSLMVEWLGKCDAFVLFASRTSLSSPNVLFEVDEAERLNLTSQLGRVITFVIDDEVPFDKLPRWLQPYNARKTSSPRDCAREILHHLHAINEEHGQSLFFGRTRELHDLESSLVPVTDAVPAHLITLYGLPGMGKRTLAKRVGRDVLQFHKNVILPIAVADTPAEFLALLEDEVGSAAKGDAPIDSVTEKCVARLHALIALQTLPVLQDLGGLLTNQAELSNGFDEIFDSFLRHPTSYLAITSRRKIAYRDPLSRPQVHVVGLPKPDTSRLLAKLSSLAGITVDAGRLSILADYVAGYPLAAQLAISLARRQGVDMVLAQKEQLIEFRASTFVRLLQGDRNLDRFCRRALAVLWLYGPMPLDAVAAGLSITTEDLGKKIEYLFDSALVDFDERGYYIIEPLYDVIDWLLVEEEINHVAVAQALRRATHELRGSPRTLSLRRSLYRSEVKAKLPISDDAFRFTSDLFALAKRAYDDDDFETAVELAREAREYNADNFEVLELLTKAFVKSDRWTEAHDLIQEIDARGGVRHASFLRGFLLRNRGKYAPALREFLDAWRRGMDSGSVHREIAFVAFRLNDLETASKHIAIAEARERDNPFIVDLQIQIATAKRDEKIARTKLERLAIVEEDKRYYNHRKSIVEASFGHGRAALAAAIAATPLLDRAPIHYLIQLARTQTDNAKLAAASITLKEIEKSKRPRDRAATKLLRAKWEVASGNAEQALILSGTDPFFDTALWKEVRLAALTLALQTVATNDPRRSDFEAELIRLASSK